MSKNNQVRSIISGGGTGGHIFPAIAIADGIKANYPEAEILFIGAKGKMEMEKVPKAGYDIIGLDVQGLSRASKIKNFVVLFKFAFAVLKSMKIIRRFKPDFVVGVGGYASGAVLKAATFLNVPIIIQEQNSLPGKTNIMLSKNADAICVAYPGLDKYFPKDKIVFSGNPIRKEFVDLKMKSEEAYNYFGIKDRTKKVVLVVGGSQGALAINKAIAKDIDKYIAAGAFVIWQVGKSYKDEAEQLIERKKITDVWCSDFIYRMDLAYSVADIVVSRSGAIALSELCAVGLPCVLVPLPTAAENHQMVNAMTLVERGAAVLVENDKAEDELANSVIKYLADSQALAAMSSNIKQLAVTNAVERIVNIIGERYVATDNNEKQNGK